MWGFLGMHLIVDPVVKWAEGGTWGSSEELGETVQDKCAEATKRAKLIVRARGGSADDLRLLFSVLFAGYVNGQQSAVPVDELDFVSEFPSDGEKHVRLPFGGRRTVLAKYHPESTIRDASDLPVFMDAVSASASGLNPPVDIWEITPDGSTKVEPETS
jgi:hypothetical protein